MAFVGKIFDNTPSGKMWKKLRDDSLKKCKDNGHIMSNDYKRINNKSENGIVWQCINCNMKFMINFKNKNILGGADNLKCPGHSWL